jgi:hypothetical protein
MDFMAVTEIKGERLLDIGSGILSRVLGLAPEVGLVADWVFHSISK